MKRVISVVLMLAVLMMAVPMTASASGKGDFNDDNRVNTSDVRDIMRMTVHEGSANRKQVWWCDYNQDGQVTTSDAREVLMQSMISGEAINYTVTDNRDWWGEKSVALLGDSISFGAGAEGNLADYCYAGMLKKAFNKANGSTNYGFMPAYTTNWSPRSEEVCGWPTMTGGPGVSGNSDGWSETDNGNRLMTFGLTAYKQYASLTYKLRSGYDFEYMCVYYQTGPSHGSFVVADNRDGMGYDKTEVGASSAKVYDCENTVNETKRTGFFRVDDFQNGFSINIVSGDNQPVTICGLGFYNDISGNAITFNKYTRGGAMLTSLSDTVLSQAASSGTLILGLGYNDAFWGHEYGYTKADFTNRINYLIAECNKNGTKVVVNDYLWSNYNTLAQYKAWGADLRAQIDEKFVFFRSELKRLAKETDGIYVSQEDTWGDLIIGYANANDGVHPVNAGHEFMATALLEAMGLA